MIMYSIKIHGKGHGRGKFTGNVIHLMEITAGYKFEISPFEGYRHARGRNAKGDLIARNPFLLGCEITRKARVAKQGRK